MAKRAQGVRGARERLLDAAEKLFAERGFEATSVRDITGEAKCNLAAVNYHFGSKEDLYKAAFVRLARELRAWRERRLQADLRRAARTGRLEKLLRSFVIAFLEEFGSEERRRRLDAFIESEIRNQHLPPETFFRELLEATQRLALEMMRRAVPRLDTKNANFCVESLMGLLIHARKIRALTPPFEIPAFYRGASSSDLVEHIVSFVAGGIRAVAQSDTGNRIHQRGLRPGQAGKQGRGMAR